MHRRAGKLHSQTAGRRQLTHSPSRREPVVGDPEPRGGSGGPGGGPGRGRRFINSRAGRRPQTIRLPARALRPPPSPPPPPPPPTRGESEPLPRPSPRCPPPLRPARARQVGAHRAVLGAERLEAWGPVLRFFRPGQLLGVSLSGDVPGPRLRNAPSRAGSPGPRRRWCQPRPPRASVSATVQWGGPPAPRREGRMPRRPVAPHRPAARPPGVRLPRRRGAVQAGPERGRASHGPRCPPQPGRWRRALAPAGPGAPRVAAHPRRAGDRLCRGPRGSPEQELRAQRARPPPRTCPRPAQVCPAGVPGLALQTGAARAFGAALAAGAFHPVAGRGPAASPARGQNKPGAGVGGGLRAPYAFAASPGLLGAKQLCKPLIVTVIFAGMSHPGGQDVVVAAAAVVTFSPSTY